jgi:hypothetical protein
MILMTQRTTMSGYAPGADNPGTWHPSEKSSKIIALLEEFRRNDPNQGNDRDEVAEALAEPADAQVVLDAIRAAEKAEDGC